MAERRGRSDGPTPIAASLEKVAARLTKADLTGLAAIQETFDAVVGTPMSAHASPLRLKDGVLVIAVDQPVWATQVRLLSGELAARLGEAAGTTIRGVDVVVRGAPRSP